MKRSQFANAALDAPAGAPLGKGGAGLVTPPTAESSNGSADPLTLADVQAQIANTKAEASNLGTKTQEAYRDLQLAEQALGRAQNIVANERRALARLEAAVAYAQETKRKKPVGEPGETITIRLPNPRTGEEEKYDFTVPPLLSEVEEMADELPALQQAVATAKAHWEARRAQTPGSFLQSRLSHLVEPLRGMLADARQQVADLEVLAVQAETVLRTEHDPDRILEFRRLGDQLPIRTVCAKLTAIETELALGTIVGWPNYGWTGNAKFFQLNEAKDELLIEKSSLVLSKDVRSTTHLWRDSLSVT